MPGTYLYRPGPAGAPPRKRRLRVPRRSSGGTRCATAQAVRHRPALATRSHEGRRSTACLAHHKARGLAARCAAAPLPPGRAGPCACCASATPRRACGRSTPTRRGWAPRLLRSLRSLRFGGGRAPCGRLFRAHGLRPSARRPPAVARVLAPARPPLAPPAAVALRASLAWAVRARRSRCRCSGPAGPCNGPRPVRPLGLRGPRVGTACGHAATLARSRSGPPALRFAPSRAGGLPGLRAGQGLRAPHF